MTKRDRVDGVKVVLLDIEGTTTPISFVYETLFPFARARLRTFVIEQGSDPEIARAIELLKKEQASGKAADLGLGVADYAERLMDQDSKSPGLKALQGLIWKVGYESRQLRGEVFEDVPAAIRGWRARGVRVAIYSSGSALAQRLIFGSTPYGDLSREIDAFFDTEVGPKREATSYMRIARKLKCASPAILFVSDVMPELAAATEAEYQTALIVRPGNPPQTGVGQTPVVHSLLDLTIGRT